MNVFLHTTIISFFIMAVIAATLSHVIKKRKDDSFQITVIFIFFALVAILISIILSIRYELISYKINNTAMVNADKTVYISCSGLNSNKYSYRYGYFSRWGEIPSSNIEDCAISEIIFNPNESKMISYTLVNNDVKKRFSQTEIEVMAINLVKDAIKDAFKKSEEKIGI